MEFHMSDAKRKKPTEFSNILRVYDFLSTIALKLQYYTRLQRGESIFKRPKLKYIDCRTYTCNPVQCLRHNSVTKGSIVY